MFRIWDNAVKISITDTRTTETYKKKAYAYARIKLCLNRHRCHMLNMKQCNVRNESYEEHIYTENDSLYINDKSTQPQLVLCISDSESDMHKSNWSCVDLLFMVKCCWTWLGCVDCFVSFHRFKHMLVRSNSESAAFYRCGQLELTKTNERLSRLLNVQQRLNLAKFALECKL